MKLYGNYDEDASYTITRLLMDLGVDKVYERIQVCDLRDHNVWLQCGEHIYRANLPYTTDEVFHWHVTVKDEDIDAFPDTIEYWRPVTDFEKQQSIWRKENTAKLLKKFKNYGF